MTHRNSTESLDLVAGELVEVASREEILSTLDQNGKLDSMPFMPEMLAWCGRPFRVERRGDRLDLTHQLGRARGVRGPRGAVVAVGADREVGDGERARVTG